MPNRRDERIVVFGTAGHAGHVIDVIEEAGEYEIYGLIERMPGSSRAHGYHILGTDADLSNICREGQVYKAFAAIGDNWTRRLVMQAAKQQVSDLSFVTLIHPSVNMSEKATAGAGTIVSPGCTINNNVVIGEGCIVGTGSVVEHDVVLGPYSSLLPAAVLAGNVKVGRLSVMGLGSKTVHNVTIGSHCVVGAGSIVLKDIPDSVVVYGCPARLIRKRRHDEPYL